MKQHNTFSALYVILVVALHSLLNTACERMPNDRHAETLYSAGKQWRDQHQLDSAINYFFQAEDAITPSIAPVLKAKIYANIADMMLYNKSYDSAIDYFHKVLDNYRIAGNRDMEAYTLMDIGNCHRMKRDSLPVIRSYYDQALAALPNDTITGDIIQKIGLCFYFYNMHDSARHYLHKSLGYPHFEQEKSITLLFLGTSFYDTQQLDSTEYYLLQALQSDPGLRQRTGCYTMLHRVAIERKDSAAIAHYGSLHAEYSDSIATIDARLSNELHDIQTQKTEKLAVQKAKRNRWLAFFIGLTCVATGACWLAVKAYRKRKAQAKQAEEQVRLASVKTQELEKTLEQERLRREAFEQLKEDLMRKYETEEGRAMERKRLAYEERLAKAFQAAERYPALHVKHKEGLLAACEKHLRWSDTQRFTHLLNKEFNGFADKIEKRYFQRHSASQATMRLCILLLLGVQEMHILSIMDYTSKDYRQALDRTCDRFHVKTADELIVALKDLVLEDEEE